MNEFCRIAVAYQCIKRVPSKTSFEIFRSLTGLVYEDGRWEESFNESIDKTPSNFSYIFLLALPVV